EQRRGAGVAVELEKGAAKPVAQGCGNAGGDDAGRRGARAKGVNDAQLRRQFRATAHLQLEHRAVDGGGIYFAVMDHPERAEMRGEAAVAEVRVLGHEGCQADGRRWALGVRPSVFGVRCSDASGGSDRSDRTAPNAEGRTPNTAYTLSPICLSVK